MKILRSIHLYLGCIFAPILIFFAVSGLWQTFSLERSGNGGKPSILAYLSTLHTGHGLKTHGIQTLSSPYMKWFVVAMAVSLIFTIILGIIMAYQFGHRKIATYCLLTGILVPIACIIVASSG